MKLKRLLRFYLLLILLAGGWATAFAQLQLPVPDLQKAAREDQAFGGSPRFAVPVPTAFSPDTQGEWERLPEGGRRWVLELESPGALGLAAIFDDFYLPVGCELYCYAPGRDAERKRFTFMDNRKSRQFFTGFTRGERMVLELYEPDDQRGRSRLNCQRVDYAYDEQGFGPPTANPASSFGFGTSQDCHDNANCSGSEEWEKVQRGVCRIVMVLEEGTGYCSGSLVNNTAEDETPYVLSAYHCQDGYTPIYDLWRFDFGYQSAGCQNPAQEPGAQSLLGCVERAGWWESDFLLLEITAAIPAGYPLYFNGWDRSGTPPQSGYLFHHPSGDIKKRSRYLQPAVVQPTVIDWSINVTPPNHHYRVRYSEGTFEVGSSGSPLFGQDKLIYGQLHGGVGDCDEQPITYYGRLSVSWDDGSSPETRLRDWLDPLGLGVDTLGGREQQLSGSVSIGGRIANEAGVPIVNAEVIITGPVEDTVLTDDDGLYTFFDVPLGGIVGLRAQKEDAAASGVSNFDMFHIAQHTLALQQLDSPYKMISADVNGSGNISVLDQIRIQKVLLGIDLEFDEDTPAWHFLPAAWPIGEDPFQSYPLPEFYMIQDITGNITNLDFIGAKAGDVNVDAPTDN